MKLRGLRKWLRLRPVDLEGESRKMDNVDGTASGASLFASPTPVGPGAPPNWVPSQQDWGRPKH